MTALQRQASSKKSFSKSWWRAKTWKRRPRADWPSHSVEALDTSTHQLRLMHVGLQGGDVMLRTDRLTKLFPGITRPKPFLPDGGWKWRESIGWIRSEKWASRNMGWGRTNELSLFSGACLLRPFHHHHHCYYHHHHDHHRRHRRHHHQHHHHHHHRRHHHHHDHHRHHHHHHQHHHHRHHRHHCHHHHHYHHHHRHHYHHGYFHYRRQSHSAIGQVDHVIEVNYGAWARGTSIILRHQRRPQCYRW